MANTSVQIEQLNAASLLGAMFPSAVDEGVVDVVEMVRACQYRAEAILSSWDSQRSDDRAKRGGSDLVQAAMGYIAAANELIDYLPETSVGLSKQVMK